MKMKNTFGDENTKQNEEMITQMKMKNTAQNGDEDEDDDESTFAGESR